MSLFLLLLPFPFFRDDDDVSPYASYFCLFPLFLLALPLTLPYLSSATSPLLPPPPPISAIVVAGNFEIILQDNGNLQVISPKYTTLPPARTSGAPSSPQCFVRAPPLS